MGLNLLDWLSGSRASRRAFSRGNVARPQFRPTLDHLEDRVVMASPGSLALPIEVADINVVGTGADRALEVTFSVAGQVVDQVATLDLGTTDTDGVPILNLSLGPVDLNLLGLGVALDDCDGGPVTVDITAHPGQGILGDILGALGGGLDLGGILGGIDELGANLDRFLGRIDTVLDRILGRQMEVTSLFGNPIGGGPAAQQDGDVCDVLNLELGPIDLNLLGLQVETSAICLDVTADPEGGILGDLLCGLSDGLDLDGINLNDLIGRVDNLLDDLSRIIGRIDDLTDIDDRTIDRLERVIDRFERVVDRLGDRLDNLRDLERVLDRIDRVLDRLDNLTGQVDRLVDQLRDLLDDLGSRGRN